MANWEYKVISSGKGGFASPALMEKFINDLGQEQWEIIHFQSAPDNPLAFTGLARRPTQRDWTLEDAAAAAARVEADKLRAEFEAKFRAGTSGSAAAAEDEEKAGTFLAEEKIDAEGSLRRLRDTSRDDEAEATDDESGAKDEWDKLAEEDELPTFFDALRPHMRRNQRGPGMSVGVDYLAKKWKLDEADIKGALVECGLQIPADENAKPVYVEYEGELFWVNINRRGEIWINLRDKPEPVFRIVPGRRLGQEEAAAEDGPAGQPAAARAPEERRREERRENRPATVPSTVAEVGAPAAANAVVQAPSPAAPKTFLAKIRGLMRRNRRGHGWSGSFPFLTKALKTDEPGLLALLAEQGLQLQAEGEPKPAFHQEGEFLYWLQKNQRGEIWINARKARKSEAGEPRPDESAAEDEGGGPDAPAMPAEGSVAAPVATPAPANTLAAVRLLLQPKKRGEGVAALVPAVADQLGQPEEKLLEALVAAGLNVPADAKVKPTFGEHAGEIFWLNRNAKGDLWLNAKQSRASAERKPRARKKPAEPVAD
jgi:hypothetical protein